MDAEQRNRLFNTTTACAFCDSETYKEHRNNALNGVICTHCFRNVTAKYNPRFVEIFTGDSKTIAVYAYQSVNNDHFKLFSDEPTPPVVLTEPSVEFHSLDNQEQQWIHKAINWDFTDSKALLEWDDATEECRMYFQAWNRNQDGLSREQIQAIEREIEAPVFVTQGGLYADSISGFKKDETETEQVKLV